MSSLYIIIKNVDIIKLEETVNDLIVEGCWKPTGGICWDGERYYQAMIFI